MQHDISFSKVLIELLNEKVKSCKLCMSGGYRISWCIRINTELVLYVLLYYTDINIRQSTAGKIKISDAAEYL
jgi:hypothetical protein